MSRYKIIFLLLFSAFYVAGKSQTVSYISFAYDNKGNRVSRTIVIVNNTLKSVADKVTDTREDASSDSTLNEEEDYFTDYLGETEMRLYPNPTTGKLKVYISNAGGTKKGTLQVYDMNGRMIKKLSISEQTTDVDITHYTSGNYVMKVLYDNQSTEWKIIKK